MRYNCSNMNKRKLTPKQQRFVQEYLVTSNASEAYRRAYDAEKMSPAVINVKASELLKNGKVTVSLQELSEASMTETVVTLIERKEWLSSVVRGDEEQAKFSDRLRALDLLNQMEAIYIQRSEHRQATIVKLIIEEEDPRDVMEGEISTLGDPNLTPGAEE